MNKYSLYKDIGLEWMGEIPKHWVITKNRYGFRKYKNGKNESNETKVLSLTTKGVKIKRNLNFGKSTESYIGHQLVEVGDVVFTPRDFDQTPILSDVSKYDGCISNLYVVDKTKQGVLNHFVNYYWYGLKYSVDYFKIFSHGMRYSFNRFQFDEIPLLIPPPSEQQQIVTFLDDKTQKIDSLLQQKEKKIELLKEKRTSLINHFVTKGLDSNVEMKDSGVEWIGKIPNHWRIKQLKHIIKNLNSGTSVNSEGTPIININELGILKTSCVYGDVFRPSENKKVVIEEYNRVKCSVTKNNIIFSRMNTPELVGSNGYINKNFPNLFLPDRLWITEFFRDVDLSVKWLSFITTSNKFRSELSSRSTGTSPSMKNITKDDLLTLKTPFPPFIEQQQIVEYLDKHTKEIDTLIQLEQKKIDTLKEYRQSLISEVVTGKIRVCEEDNSLILNSQTV